MMSPRIISPCSEPEAVARAFLAALDAADWDAAAGVVHPEVAARFREQTLDIARTLGRTGLERITDADTVFPDPLRVLGTATLAEAEALSPQQIVARWAEGLHPAHHGRWTPAAPSTSSEETIRLVRGLLKVTRDGASARAYYRTEWFINEVLSPHRGGPQVLGMEMNEGEWWVVDADFGGEGDGRLLMPEGVRKRVVESGGGWVR